VQRNPLFANCALLKVRGIDFLKEVLMRAVASRLAVLGTMLASAFVVPVCAQQAAATHAFESGGLKASIGEITIKDNQNLSVQLLLNNTTKFKKYTTVNTDKADGSLSNGDIMMLQRTIGLPTCPNSTKELCVKYVADPHYVEGNSQISLILWYHDTTGRLASGGKISFPLKLVVQTETATDEVLAGGAPKAPGQPNLVVINFTEIPLQ
jgi:hypothetical protein